MFQGIQKFSEVFHTHTDTTLRFLLEHRPLRRGDICCQMVSMIFSDCSSSTTARLLPLSRQHGVVSLRRLAVGPLHVGPPSRCSPSTRTLTLHSSTSPSPILAGTSPLALPALLFRFCLVAQKMKMSETREKS